MCQHRGMSGVPIRPDDPVDQETQAILDERLKTIDNDAKSARPWREVIAESQAKLKHATPQ
jgi:Putative addiction module component